MSIPKEARYDYTVMGSGIRSASYVSRTQNGSEFQESQQLQFSLLQNNNTFLVPSSLFMVFTIEVDADAGAVDNILLGIPGASVFQRSDVFINSVSVDTISNYNAIQNQLLHSKLSASQKQGLSSALGLEFAAGNANLIDSVDVIGASGTNTIKVAVPMLNCIALCNNLYPLFAGDVRFYLTVDQLANIACKADGSATSLTNLKIKDAEIHYKAITFPPEMVGAILSQRQADGRIYMKTESYETSVAPLAAGSSGTQALVYSNSLTSIKSVMSSVFRTDRYKNFAAYDPNLTQYSYEIAGIPYPQTAINVSQHGKAQVLMEYLEAVHGIATAPTSASSCLSTNNFRAIDVAFGNDTDKDLSKAFLGVNTERLASSEALNGVSSQNSTVVARLNIGVATVAAATVLTTFLHDVVLMFDPETRSVQVMK